MQTENTSPLKNKIIVHTVIHKPVQNIREINNCLKRCGWQKISGRKGTQLWKGSLETLNCKNDSDLVERLRIDFQLLSELYGVKITIVYKLK
ncbi:hypothetical protein BH10BAC5_BH10BAC5_08000 [soil metagenome]